MFGGSGYLSYIAKFTCKNNRVIYNDYDHYSDRLLHINETEEILSKIKEMIKNENIIRKNERLNDNLANEIKKLLKEKKDKGEYVDWITISSQLCFTMNTCHNYEEFENKNLYNNPKKASLNTCGNYLDGIEIVHMDWKELYNKYENEEHVIFLIDPPYPNTLTEQYKNNITEEENLKLLDILHDKENVFYFTSSKSRMLELFSWKYNREEIKIINNVNGTGNYKSYYDYCLYKINLEQ